jgi:hypothetical protein
MKKIPLTQGKFALVDDIDFERVNQFNWQAHHHDNLRWYARRRFGNMRRNVRMHRFILNEPPYAIDHCNRNGLDNQRKNLRAATPTQNAMNRKRRCDSQTGIKGVTLRRDLGKFQARINVQGKRISLGCFDKLSDAATAYRKAAKKYFGEFARV